MFFVSLRAHKIYHPTLFIFLMAYSHCFHLFLGMKKGNSRQTSNAQTIQKWALLPTDLSEKNGDLTPTLKLKRSVVVAKYNALIESMYAE